MPGGRNRDARTAGRTDLCAGRETALATATGPWVSACSRHLPLSGDGGTGCGSGEIAARGRAECRWPGHDCGRGHDDSAEFASGTDWFGLSLSAGRLGHLSSVEHRGGLVVRLIGRLRDGDLRRRLRVCGGVPHQPDTKTVSRRGFGRGHHRCRLRTGKDRNQRALRARSRASRSKHGVVRDCGFRPHGDDGPRGLGQGIA